MLSGTALEGGRNGLGIDLGEFAFHGVIARLAEHRQIVGPKEFKQLMQRRLIKLFLQLILARLIELTGGPCLQQTPRLDGMSLVRAIKGQDQTSGIPVMGHVGFTPQSEHGLGGHLIQGRGEAAADLLADARAVEEAGAFAVVLEMVPSSVAAEVTAALSIPTISVGAGPECDGQLMVWTDWAGLTSGRIPRFVKRYADLAGTLHEAVVSFREDVEQGRYPGPEHEYEA